MVFIAILTSLGSTFEPYQTIAFAFLKKFDARIG